jgi:hypothetical protein
MGAGVGANRHKPREDKAMRIDLGRMTEEEIFELVQEAIPNLKEEHLYPLLDLIAETTTKEEAIAHLEKGKSDG